MPYQPRRSWIERKAVQLGLIADTDGPATTHDLPPSRPLARFPAPQQWHDVAEADPAAWPREEQARHYRLVPTTCFNCESACGLLAYVDKQTYAIRKLEGNPHHPASRGRNCAKGPATLNQVNDPDRILTPLKRSGPRGSGQFQPVAWEAALAEIGGRIRAALREGRRDEVVYHVGRPGAEGFIDRVLRAWGIDGHNSHTNICSSGARLGYALWSGYDRPSPDYANARFILALNAHLESGHYFNPHAQRISEGLARGARMAVVDPRLSNTVSMATYWLPTRPGTEAALLLGMAQVILNEGLYDVAFMQRWVNWRETLAAARSGALHDVACGLKSEQPAAESSHSRSAFRDLPSDDFSAFIDLLKQLYATFTPDAVAAECGVPPETIVRVARHIGEAGTRFCSHTWRGAASAHLGGWQVSRCLFLLHVLTGSVGTQGGTSPAAWNKYKAHLLSVPPPQDHWNELHWPREFPLAHYEMSFLLPHLLKSGRGRIDVYFTRVFNPVWTYPDGFAWIEALRDERLIGLHVALTPTWNETAFYADYVLPMGHGPERHDLNTYETHNGTWIAFRQPVVRAARRADGHDVPDTRGSNPGLVWEEDEFWIALCWAIDPDGGMGIRKYFESPTHPGRMLTVDEYYAHAFDRVPGLPQAAAAEGLSPLDYMRKYGAFEVRARDYLRHERKLAPEELQGASIDPATGVVRRGGAAVGIEIDGVAVEGFATPGRKLEFFSSTLAEWGWPEHALPGYIPSHLGLTDADAQRGEFCLLPTFRLPTLIHTRSGSAKWLNEISQRNPVWIHTADARRLGVRTGDLVRVETRIGCFVDRAWVTEAIRPGVVACSHHLGRWRRRTDPPNSRWSGSVVQIDEPAPGQWRMRLLSGPTPFDSPDPDSRRIWWRDGGVPQNLTFPVHPDPISGMHCWHQRVRVRRADPDDRPGDVAVDTAKSMHVFREWMSRTRVVRSDLRRPLWLNRPLRPTDAAYQLPGP